MQGPVPTIQGSASLATKASPIIRTATAALSFCKRLNWGNSNSDFSLRASERQRKSLANAIPCKGGAAAFRAGDEAGDLSDTATN